MMLARVADSLYWTGRYAERAEHVARLVEVMLAASVEQAGGEQAARIARVSMGAAESEILELADGLVFGGDTAGSIVSSLAWARENVRQVRDQVTTEMWEKLNSLHLRMNARSERQAMRRGGVAYLRGVIGDMHQFRGAADATMSHGEGWRFLQLGAFTERAQLIARLLDASFGSSADGRPLDGHTAQASVLRMASGLEPYLRVYTADLKPEHILQFLLFDAEFPRSLRFATERIKEMLTDLSGAAARLSEPERLAGRLAARLAYADPRAVAGGDAAADLLAAVAADCDSIHHAVHTTYVAYPLETNLPA